MMKSPFILLAVALTSPTWAESFRPPAVPLVTHDPYFSIYSEADQAYAKWPSHWTGHTQALGGMIRVDGVTHRFLGDLPEAKPVEQKSVTVHPTRTVYEFTTDGVALTVTFLSPLLPHDLEIFARPITYVTTEVKSLDGKEHAVSVYLDASAETAVHEPKQKVTWTKVNVPGLNVASFASEEQAVLKRRGDDVRIDWGRFLLANDSTGSLAMNSDKLCRGEFANTGKLPAANDTEMPRAANDRWPVLACVKDFAKVGATTQNTTFLLAYDDGAGAIEWMHKPLLSWWKRNGVTMEQLLEKAWGERATLAKTCADYDAALEKEQIAIGGEKYSQIASLAFRQAWAAHKLVASPTGEPWFFSKENFSNGCIATVDVTYPSAPIMLLFQPELLKGLCTPICEYALGGKWPYQYAPHDLGTYPQANGQVYGMGDKDTDGGRMPVEECGNMMICLAGIAKAEGKLDYVKRYWPLLERWAAYLETVGFDPNNQLCTDDFAGHLAHNANLSLKTIVALGSFGQLCEQLGKKEEGAKWSTLAKQMAADWQKAAQDGDHYRLAFDQAGSWSMKYNMVWDRILGLGLFPAIVAETEMKHYRKVQQKFGLPLDSRKTYTKSDWLVWTATLTGKRDDFEALINPLWDSLNQTTNRPPMTDWYETTNAKQVGFQARSVVGGVYIPFLYNESLWTRFRTGKAVP